MLPGQTAYKDGVQCALFPLDILWCTQVSGPGEFTHCCGYPTDWIGTYAQYPYYAPFDCHRIDSGAGLARYCSNTEVLTPSGKKWITVEFLHDDDIPLQTNFRQGELIGHTGTTGFVTGDHVHLDQCASQVWIDVPSGIICGSGNECYEVLDGLPVYDAFWITGDEQVVTTLGLTFQVITDYHSGKLPVWLLGAALKKKKRGDYGPQHRIYRL